MQEQFPAQTGGSIGYESGQHDSLTQLKGAFEEMSQEAKIVGLGKLTDLMPESTFSGAISVTARLAEGTASTEGLAAANEALHKSYVPVSEGASIRCVDGRAVEGYDDSHPDSYKIGPQIQGGTPDIAVARRLRKGVQTDAKLEADVDELVQHDSTAFKPAGHTDDHAPVGGYGCGALKGQETKLDYYADDEKLGAVVGVTSAVLDLAGKTLPEDFGATLKTNAANLADISESYFAGKPEVLDYLKQFNQEARQVLTGAHNEFKVVLNLVSGTTLNSGKLNTLTDGKYNAFGLDVWYIMENYPEDAAYIIADALTTLMNLTDGSLDVEARMPAEAELPTAA